jgi:CheY-like chemotaxis protein
MEKHETNGPRVLIVDDHHDGAETLGLFLEMLECDVRVTYSGEEALALSPAFRPHLVILDVQMPGIGGLETARRMRAQEWALRSVIASHSASADPATARLSKQAGCQYHLCKPAALEAFEKLVAATELCRRR